MMSIMLTQQEQTKQILQELRIPAHRLGYIQLCLAIPRYRENPLQSLSKNLYPWLGKQFDNISPQAVEHAIREAILYGWRHRDSEIWEKYFPGAIKQPTNKQFIAALSECLK